MQNDEKLDLKLENKESDINTRRMLQNLSKQLFLIALAVFLGMFCYEFLKSYFLPSLTVWQSHFITIVFSTIIATLAAYTILKNRNELLEEISDSERKYRKIFNNIQDVYYQTNMDGKIIEISPSIERYSGFKPEELLGKPVEMIYYDIGDRDLFINEIQEKGEVVDYELRLKTINGDLFYTSNNAHFLFDSNNKRIGIEGSLRDLNERKKAEEEMKKTTEKYRFIAEKFLKVSNEILQEMNKP